MEEVEDKVKIIAVAENKKQNIKQTKLATNTKLVNNTEKSLPVLKNGEKFPKLEPTDLNPPLDSCSRDKNSNENTANGTGRPPPHTQTVSEPIENTDIPVRPTQSVGLPVPVGLTEPKHERVSGFAFIDLTTADSEKNSPKKKDSEKNLAKKKSSTKSKKSLGKRGGALVRGDAPFLVDNQSLLTDYFRVRRSNRRTESQVKSDNSNLLEKLVLNADESELRVVEFGEKGRGVVTTRSYERDEFVVEYAGDIVGKGEASKRERLYAVDESLGCYMYYFIHGGSSYCVDATEETGRLGRLVNHSRAKPNCVTKSLRINGEIKLILVAKRSIEPGEELVYDYGDRSKTSLLAHPWLAY